MNDCQSKGSISDNAVLYMLSIETICFYDCCISWHKSLATTIMLFWFIRFYFLYMYKVELSDPLVDGPPKLKLGSAILLFVVLDGQEKRALYSL